MPPPKRQSWLPGTKEVGKRIRQAAEAIEAGHYQVIDETQNKRTYESLGVSDLQGLLEHVLDFLDEIQGIGAEKCFCGIGGRVEFCNKSGFSDVALYAYSWHSQKMGKGMYLKFGVKERGSKTVFTYMHLSCHDDE